MFRLPSRRDSNVVYVILAAALGSYVLLKITQYYLRKRFSVLHYLKGPKNQNLLYGNLKEVLRSNMKVVYNDWPALYGHVMKIHFLFGLERYLTTDLKAINHVLTHSFDYQKPEQAKYSLSRVLDDGILVSEGEKHRIQRRIMNPSFSITSIRELVPIFNQKALELRDVWMSQVIANENPQRIDVLSWLSRASLDIIGLAGFGYRFDSLKEQQKPNELREAFATLTTGNSAFSSLRALQTFFPTLRAIKSERDRIEDRARQTLQKIGRQLLQARKKSEEIDESVRPFIENLNGRDLLSVLVKANADDSIPGKNRMSEKDVIAQVPTFMIAGHESTSVQITWSLYSLAQHKDVQSKLREELRTVITDDPSMEELSSLSYLDAVVRETLRVHAAVPSTTRVATNDDTIPVSKPFYDRNGVLHDSIMVKAGEIIVLPIIALNKSKEIWGENAFEFDPDRWHKLPEAAYAIPGVWGNLLTFLGGARSCIGYRFALIEMKALLFALIRSFEFDLAVPDSAIERRTMIVTRPYLRSDPKGPAQMPLLVRLAEENI